MEAKELTPELYKTILAIVDERVKEIKVTREDFNELKGVVQRLGKGIEELAEAQKRTEERLNRLEAAVERLAEAQKRTEERLNRLEAVVEELAEAQKRTEERLNRLEAVVEELAEAQKRTEERVNRLEAAVERLAEAQRRTEERVKELAQAQTQTQKALRELSIQVGRLSDTVGYGLEDIALVMLPPYLEKHYGIKIEDPGKRFLEVAGEEIEINLYAEGERDGREIVVIGEIKSRIYEREVEKFIQLLKKVTPGIEKEVLKVMFGYFIHPSAEKLAKREDILLVASYMR